MTKKTIIVIILILVALGFYYLAESKPEPTKDTEIKSEESKMAEYFMEQIIILGTKDVGQPVEGFDAELIRLAFPGFIIQDFEQVETLGGHYDANGEDLKYIHKGNNQITSAEKTISLEGYGTLLRNISDRLSIQATTKESIDSIIERVNVAEKISVKMSESRTFSGITITPIEIIEDSRCSTDVTCIQAGTVRLNAKLKIGISAKENEQIFILNEPVITENGTEIIMLVAVEPEPTSKTNIEKKDHIFHFEIEKLPVEIIETEGGL